MTAAEMPPRDDRKPGLGKEGALVADLLKLLLKIRARDIDVAAKLLPGQTSWKRWRPASVMGWQCCRGGDLSSSAAMRWRWSKAGWVLR